MRLALPRIGRRNALLACAAALVIAVAGVGLLTSAPGRSTTLKPARSFSLAMLGESAGRVTLALDKGKPVIINFFASWCTPCRKETPLLASFYREHHGQVLVIGVDSNDQRGSALKFVREHGVSYPVGFDPTATVAVSYGVAALPQTFFLNARHQIARHVIGAVTSLELTEWAASLPHQKGTS